MIQMRLLGSVDLRDEAGHPIQALLSRPKRLALLAYLAVAGRDGFRRKDKLFALFWPESDQPRARQALRQSLYILRSELGEASILRQGDEAVALNRDAVVSDVDAFMAALDAGDDQAAVDLYAGDLLDGFHLSGVGDFERWLDEERALLRRSCAAALDRLAAQAESEGDPEAVARRRRDQVAFDPFNSHTVLRAARAADDAGAPAEAVRIIREHEERLRAELELPLPMEVAEYLAALSSRETAEAGRASAATTTPTEYARPVAPEVRSDRHVLRLWAAAGAAIAVLTAGTLWWNTTRAEGPQIQRVAVLPFENLMNDPEQEYFVQGLHDALISELARRELGVIARTSVMQYRDTDEPVPVIASELGADALVEGSVSRAADSMTIHVRLVDAGTEQFLWSGTYTAAVRDATALNAALARAIARSIRPGVDGDGRSVPTDAVHADVYDDYLRGQFYLRGFSPPELDNALLYFQSALQKDSIYAPAYAGISTVWSVRRQRGYVPPREATPHVNAAAFKALQLDSTLAEPYYALAIGRTWGDWDWQGGETAFREAIKRKPDYPQARALYAHLLCILGRPREAIDQIERARALDPLDPQTQWLYGAVLALVRRYDDAVAQYRATLRKSPHNAAAQWLLWLTLHLRGDHREAFAEALEWADAARDPEIAAALRSGYAASGYEAGLRAAADALVARSRTQYVGPWTVAIWYAAAGERDRALEWLEEAYRIGDPGMPYLAVHPIWEGLRKDPRYQDLLRRMNL